jgi:hypothetical protein
MPESEWELKANKDSLSPKYLRWPVFDLDGNLKVTQTSILRPLKTRPPPFFNMKITAIFALAVVCVTATVVNRAPATADITPIEKRDTEILYLANCLSAVSCCTPEKDWFEMIVSPTHSSESGRDAVGLSTDTPCSTMPTVPTRITRSPSRRPATAVR